MAWDLVVRSKETGELGLRNLKKKNLALVGKWFWRFPREQQSLWARVIKSKYGMQNNGWDTKVVTNGSFRNPWKFISQDLNIFSKHSLKGGEWNKNFVPKRFLERGHILCGIIL